MKMEQPNGLAQASNGQSELAQSGISFANQNEFCKSISTLKSARWSCAQTLLKKYGSLELAKDICLSSAPSQSACYVDAINRNFDP